MRRACQESFHDLLRHRNSTLRTSHHLCNHQSRESRPVFWRRWLWVGRLHALHMLPTNDRSDRLRLHGGALWVGTRHMGPFHRCNREVSNGEEIRDCRILNVLANRFISYSSSTSATPSMHQLYSARRSRSSCYTCASGTTASASGAYAMSL